MERMSTPEAILIDDDIWIRDAWQLKGDTMGVQIDVFESGAAFLRVAAPYDRDIPIFIDIYLGAGADGLVVGDSLAQLGFRRIYVATAVSPLLERRPWMAGVIGKSPPDWLFSRNA